LAENACATNLVVTFTALPGGNRNNNGTYNNIGNNGNWWSSTESSTTYAYLRGVLYDNSIVFRFDSEKLNGFSVRCLKDN
jgi:uncharacterized protein (TIGR02145 family)